MTTIHPTEATGSCCVSIVTTTSISGIRCRTHPVRRRPAARQSNRQPLPPLHRSQTCSSARHNRPSSLSGYGGLSGLTRKTGETRKTNHSPHPCAGAIDRWLLVRALCYTISVCEFRPSAPCHVRYDHESFPSPRSVARDYLGNHHQGTA